jgi:hypothetical protein
VIAKESTFLTQIMKIPVFIAILQFNFSSACRKKQKEEIETTTEITTTTEATETTTREKNENYEDLDLERYFPINHERRPVIPTSYPEFIYDEELPSTTSVETTSTTVWSTETTSASTIRFEHFSLIY